MTMQGSWLRQKGTPEGAARVVAFAGRLFGVAQTEQAESQVLSAWNEQGLNCLAALDGEFAAVVAARGSLVAFGDPLGSLPLYYAVDEHHLYWSTDLDELATRISVATRSDDFLYSFLLNDLIFRHPYDPGETLYREIKRLPAGTFLRVTPDHVTLVPGWSWETDEYKGLSYEEVLAEFDRRFSRAVAKRIVGQDRVGVLLSGGLDSTAVATAAAHLVGAERVVPISYVFPTMPSVDESERIARFSQALGLRGHHVAADQINFFTDLLDHYPALSQPLNLTNLEGARQVGDIMGEQGASVLLTGHGGDAVFGVSHLAPGVMLRLKKYREFQRWWRQMRRYQERPPGYLFKHILVPTYFRPEALFPHNGHEHLQLPDWIVPQNERQRSMQVDPCNQYATQLFQADNDSTGSYEALLPSRQVAWGHPFFDRDVLMLLLNCAPWYKHWPQVNPKRLLKDWLTRHLPPEIVRQNAKKVGSIEWNMTSLRQARPRLDQAFEGAAIFELGMVEKRPFLEEYGRFLQGMVSNQRAYATFLRAVMLEGWLQARSKSR